MDKKPAAETWEKETWRSLEQSKASSLLHLEKGQRGIATGHSFHSTFTEYAYSQSMNIAPLNSGF